MKQRAARPSGKLKRETHPGPARSDRFLPSSLLLIAAVLLAYQPLWHAGFIWDDDSHVTANPTLLDLHGLWRIWFEVGAVPQYYPLVHTVFWLERHLWGLAPLGFHLVNVLLHATAAILLAKALLRWRVPGAWLAAAIFALHPVSVESVAWVTELKNVLSTVFYLAAALAYWRFADLEGVDGTTRRRWRWYAAALLLFIAALLSKTVTCSLPVALLLVRWWQMRRVRLVDVAWLLPFFIVGAALGLQTAWIEKHGLGAGGATWSLGAVERGLVAGRALWFYARKLLVPVNLTFIYPRWDVRASVWWQWSFPVAFVAVVGLLWWMRNRIGRGPLTAVVFFAVTLTPALGFFDVYPMRYSFVADHFQYVASIGLITLATALATTHFHRVARGMPARYVAAGSICFTLGLLSWRQARMYADEETLWRTTLARNPDCSIAHNNLGNLLLARGDASEALAHYHEAVADQPDNAEAHESLGNALLGKGQPNEAIAEFETAQRLNPDRGGPYYNIGTALLQEGRTDEGMLQFERAIAVEPGHVLARNNLGIILLGRGQVNEAIAQFKAALQLKNDFAEAHNNLGTALLRSDRHDEAVAHYREALKFRPDFAEAHDNLATALLARAQFDEAVAHYRAVIRLRQDSPAAHDRLRQVAWILATYPDASVRNGAKALALAREASEAVRPSPTTLATLAAAYAETGNFAEAIATAEHALALAKARDDTAAVGDIDTQLAAYRAGRAYRQAIP